MSFFPEIKLSSGIIKEKSSDISQYKSVKKSRPQGIVETEKSTLKKKFNTNNDFINNSTKGEIAFLPDKPNKNNFEDIEKFIDSNQKSVDIREFNIFQIDALIKKSLESQISTLPELERDLENLLGKKGNKNQSSSNAALLRRRIQDLESTFELGLYIHKTADILEKYKKSLESGASKNFVCVTSSSISQVKKEADSQHKLISQYVSIAREYITITGFTQKQERLKCTTCNGEELTRLEEDESVFVCSHCGTEVEILDDLPTFKDTDRVNMANRYTYSRRGHFIDAMKKFQGKHNIDVEQLQSVVEEVNREIALHNLTPNTVTKDQVYVFLSENKLSSYYDDIHLIFHFITGKPCADFSYLEPLLLELFEIQEAALEEISDIYEDSDIFNTQESRVNSINVYYKLYKLLQKVGYSCKKSDFYILKTKAKEDEHDEKMMRAWKSIGWTWIDTY